MLELGDSRLVSYRLPISDAELYYWPNFLSVIQADNLQQALMSQVTWQQERLLIFGKSQPVPRLVAWHGDAQASYRYSGVNHRPEPWIPSLEVLRDQLNHSLAHAFNSVLLNRYRNGADSMGWHSDDEPELGLNPVIASLSLGETRRMRFRHRQKDFPSLGIDLQHGSLLLMAGTTQHHWQHAIPKTCRTITERINLTFRQIK